MSREKLIHTFNFAYDCLRRKINGGSILVDNEASLQLQFASILKTVGELLLVGKGEYFSIELEKSVQLIDRDFPKSGSKKAKVDVFFSFHKGEEKISCAVEMKFFKKKNQREPNSRYDVFSDISNLELYGNDADLCFLLVATDHNHYVNQSDYSTKTAAFDFRDGKYYLAGTEAIYGTPMPYGKSITLHNSYAFSWDKEIVGGLHFLKLEVNPINSDKLE